MAIGTGSSRPGMRFASTIETKGLDQSHSGIIQPIGREPWIAIEIHMDGDRSNVLKVFRDLHTSHDLIPKPREPIFGFFDDLIRIRLPHSASNIPEANDRGVLHFTSTGLGVRSNIDLPARMRSQPFAHKPPQIFYRHPFRGAEQP
mgnify:CR=1 FL=1